MKLLMQKIKTLIFERHLFCNCINDIRTLNKTGGENNEIKNQ